MLSVFYKSRISQNFPCKNGLFSNYLYDEICNMATFIWGSVLFSDIYNRNLKENQIFQTFSNKASDFAASAFNCRLVTWCIDALQDPLPRRPLRQPSREMPIFPGL
jgi:hypothetical protein